MNTCSNFNAHPSTCTAFPEILLFLFIHLFVYAPFSASREERQVHHLTAHPGPLPGPHLNCPETTWLKNRHPLRHLLPHLHPRLLRHLLLHLLSRSRRRKSPRGWLQRLSRRMKRARKRRWKQKGRRGRRGRCRAMMRQTASLRSSKMPLGQCR